MANSSIIPVALGIGGVVVVLGAALAWTSISRLEVGGPGRWDEEGQWHPDPEMAQRLRRVRRVGRVSLLGAGLVAGGLAWSLGV